MKRPSRHARLKRFAVDIYTHTPFIGMVLLLVVGWLVFSGGLYLAERGSAGTPIDSYGKALYWGIAAFSTAGIADTPVSGGARFIGGIWIVLGSVLFFGAIVATVTSYFMRPMQRPHRKIIETVEYNLEQLDDLTIEELDLLRETIDTLIVHVEKLKKKRDRNKRAT
ncbi:MAG: two pore domain potassium channel family protein [Gammaproteobacteria bacterium]|nr:two pore domain potassium channel family protein [Gammaproteobacteria bacterium]MDH3450433.1 two pore domain potassium channel family protein [Gammaproteobacteria bacterium]